MIDKLSLVDDPFIQGRINVNQAPYEVLMGVPNMTDQLARQIVGPRTTGRPVRSLAASEFPRHDGLAGS